MNQIKELEFRSRRAISTFLRHRSYVQLAYLFLAGFAARFPALRALYYPDYHLCWIDIFIYIFLHAESHYFGKRLSGKITHVYDKF